MNNKQFIITNDEKRAIEIKNFTCQMTFIEPSKINVLIRGEKNETQEKLKDFCSKYFVLKDLDIAFNKHELVEGFKKEKKIIYDLNAIFK